MVAMTGLGMCVKDLRIEPRYGNTAMVEDFVYSMVDMAIDKLMSA